MPLEEPFRDKSCQFLIRPFYLVQAQVWIPWSPWYNAKSPIHSLECLSTPNLFLWFPSCLFGSLVPQPMPQYPRKCLWWFEVVDIGKITLSVIICVIMRSWYPRKSLGTPTPDGLMVLVPLKEWWSDDGLLSIDKVGEMVLVFKGVLGPTHLIPWWSWGWGSWHYGVPLISRGHPYIWCWPNMKP